MFEIGGRHNGRQIIVPVVISGSGSSGVRMCEAQALLDTGATSSAITADIAAELALEPLGRRIMGTAAGTRRATTYRFSVGFAESLVRVRGDAAASGPVFLPSEVQGIDFTAGLDFQVLIGMDIIARGDLHLLPSRDWAFRL